MTYSEWLDLPRPTYMSRWGLIIYPSFMILACLISAPIGYFCGAFAGTLFGYGIGSYAMMKAIEVTDELGDRSWAKIYNQWLKENPMPKFDCREVHPAVIVSAAIMSFG